MSISNSHKNAVDRQFGEQANAYLTSAVHAQGKDLQRLAQLLEPHAGARLLDLGCGAGHASFTAAARVAQVVAYDLSAQMLAVVEQTAAEKGLSNIQLQQGVAESLPFEDASFDLVISRYSAHHWHDVGQALREVKRVLAGRQSDLYGRGLAGASAAGYLSANRGSAARHLTRAQLCAGRVAGVIDRGRVGGARGNVGSVDAGVRQLGGAHAHAGAFRYRDPRAAAKRVAGGGGALRHSAGRLLYQRYHDV